MPFVGLLRSRRILLGTPGIDRPLQSCGLGVVLFCHGQLERLLEVVDAAGAGHQRRGAVWSGAARSSASDRVHAV